MLYCYFNSKWGDYRNPILEIFLNHNVVFAGGFQAKDVKNYKNKFKAGTKIAVCYGTTIKAVGIAEEDFDSLDNLKINFSEEELEQFDYSINNTVLAVKVKLFKLNEEYIEESFRRRFNNINNDEIKRKIDELIKKYSGEQAMEDIKELLKQNKNLILTGAPGTGKTYLAKQIAGEIGEWEFVQFHPSYDYTDFVEGLRPKNDNGNIGFERRDGVFKEFCKKALKNLKDSEKDINTLNYDEIIKEYLDNFCNDIDKEIVEKGEFEIDGIGGGKAAPIIEIDYNENELRYTVKTKNGIEFKFMEKIDLMIYYYKKFITKKPAEWKYKNFVAELLMSKRRMSTYIYGFLKAFYDKYHDKIQSEKNNPTVQTVGVKKKDFVFIIDEINRGEISKIFGELFFSVDPGYRGEKGKVQTQYSNLIEEDDEFKEGFYIPENVYIIGTMNDIDRSVESMDFAMRRRFAWKEIKAKDTQENILNNLKEAKDLKDEAIKRMDSLNEAVSNTRELSDAYHIGASYFLKLDNYYNENNKEEAFENLWENHLKGLLFEYTRGMPNQETILEELKNAYDLNN